MNTLCIPRCKQSIKLTEDCVVKIQSSAYEGDNNSLVAEFGYLYRLEEDGKIPSWYDSETKQRLHYRNGNDKPRDFEITFPKGTVLKINKLYIRNGGWHDDHITFRTVESPDERIKKHKGLLTIKLDEVNKIPAILSDKDGNFNG